MSPSTSTIYRVETDLRHNEVREMLSRLDVNEETARGTILRSRTGSIQEIESDCCIMTLYYDQETGPIEIDGRSRWYPIPETSDIGFIGDRYLIILESKKIADRIANNLQRFLFDNKQVIFNHSFSDEYIRRFISLNARRTGNAWMFNIDTPGVNTTSIWGPEVQNSDQYEHALRHGGQHTYVRISLVNDDRKVGISRKGSIVFQSLFDLEEKMLFIRNHVLDI